MSLVFSALVWTACCLAPPDCGAPVINYVWLPIDQGGPADCRPIPCAGNITRGPLGRPIWKGPSPDTHPEPYEPCEGDMIIYSYYKPMWKALFRLVKSGPPTHCGIIFRLPDGCMRILEAGSLEPAKVDIVEVQPRLNTYRGSLWVRRLHHPLTLEQSAKLTEYALDQGCKRFARGRFLLEGFSGRNMSRVRWLLFGPPPLDRPAYYCSELVLSALVVADVFTIGIFGPRTPDPRDLFWDKPHDLPCWYGPSRLITTEPCVDKPVKVRR
jgi:hypothetical protein